VSQPVKVTITVETDDGVEHSYVLVEANGVPLLAEWSFSREPVDDHEATAHGGMWRIRKPGPYMSIKLSAYGAVVEL
jgi:hypothetical protein